MAESTVFRPATRGDLPAVVALLADDERGRTREVVSEPLHADYLAAWDAVQASPNDTLVVAERDGEVVGCLQLTLIPNISHRGGLRGQIEAVRVAAALRGQGLGRAMMRWTIERCRDAGCRSVQLTTNAAREDARRFYLSLGFEDSHVGMKLPLS